MVMSIKAISLNNSEKGNKNLNNMDLVNELLNFKKEMNQNLLKLKMRLLGRRMR